MKRSRRKGRALAPAELAADFTRGAIATGLLAAIQGRWDGNSNSNSNSNRISGARVLRLSLQGGAALAAGAAAATSLRDRNYVAALASVVGGVAGIAAIEKLISAPNQEENEESSLG